MGQTLQRKPVSIAILIAVGLLAVGAIIGTITLTNAAADSGGQSGVLDDGKDLLPQATISVEDAIAAAQTAADGNIGEIDLEYVGDTLVFNVDVGDKDVKVNAADGSVVQVDQDD